MKIRTLEHLNDVLLVSLFGAKKELSILKSIIESNASVPAKRDAIVRSGVTVLYAHWEGFIKIAATSYLEYIVRQLISYERLTANFVAIAMKGKLNEARQTNKASIYTSVVEFLLSNLSERCEFNWEKAMVPFVKFIVSGST